ncbi:hypothetical protein U1E44_06400 [Arenibacter sp. GZD96]|uniref:hypothetical protein n=1 Tax=Aurantibrevibacter litoralis TaxID=3106030 RepID=UPI002AFE5EFF|nr:hypothetical protein [Arenibacter sp. GZD-96]MEA1785713.1 hypothetical protein [Arenibacter sp. GZD-96]
MTTTKSTAILFVLALTISCNNTNTQTQNKAISENEMTKEVETIINEAISENEAINALAEVKTIIEALDASIFMDKTTPQELATYFPIDLQKGDAGNYRNDVPYMEYKTINEFSFEEGVLNAIICASAYLDRNIKGQNNHGKEVLEYVITQLGKPEIVDREQHWEREHYNIIFRDIHFYEDGNWTLWIQSHKNYFPSEFLPEE